jgi:NAD(P)-dependent dehydrogenase (short-subunit alcohol dehydrogenase family)
MPQPSQRLAIVTGTSSGIGEVVARQLIQQGWSVIGVSRRPAAPLGANYSHVQLDLNAVTNLADSVDAQLGARVRSADVARIGLVNNAADVALLGTLDRVDPAKMLQAFATNTVAPVVLAGWLLRTAQPRVPVRIVNVSSGAGVEPFPGLGAYGATKAALRLAGMVLAGELEMREAADGLRRDVTIWSYEPGVVATPMQTAVRSSTPETVPIVQVFHDLHAAGRLRPPEVPAAEIVRYLQSDGHPRFAEQRFLLS